MVSRLGLIRRLNLLNRIATDFRNWAVDHGLNNIHVEAFNPLCRQKNRYDAMKSQEN